MTESPLSEAQKAWQEKSWQTPAFTANALEEKRNSFALVIPVINEGQRIRDQLTRISGLVYPSTLSSRMVARRTARWIRTCSKKIVAAPSSPKSGLVG